MSKHIPGSTEVQAETLAQRIQSAQPCVERIQSGVPQLVKVSDQSVLEREITIALVRVYGSIRDARDHLRAQVPETYESEQALYCLADVERTIEALIG